MKFFLVWIFCGIFVFGNGLTIPEWNVKSTLPSPTIIQNSGNSSSCYGLIFAGEMSRFISLQEKQDFFNTVLKIAGNFQSTNLKFAITTFGGTIYQKLGDFQGYDQFVSTVNALISGLPNPNSAVTYFEPVLEDIFEELIKDLDNEISTLFMGEIEGIRDPNAARASVYRVAAAKKNVYVLDYSTGAISQNLWLTLTNNHPERIVNGTGSNAETIYKQFYSTLVTDINNGNCQI